MKSRLEVDYHLLSYMKISVGCFQLLHMLNRTDRSEFSNKKQKTWNSMLKSVLTEKTNPISEINSLVW